MTHSTVSPINTLIERYAQLCVEHMGLDDVMNHEKDNIERGLNGLPRPDALEAVRLSGHADELSGLLVAAENDEAMDTSELFDQYAQRCVEDIDIGDLERGVISSIEKRLHDLPLVEVVNEIHASAYAEELADTIAAAQASDATLAA